MSIEIQDELNPNQQQFITELLNGSSIKAAAASVNIAEQTAHRWLKLAKVREPYKAAQKMIFENALTQSMADYAVGRAVLVEIAGDIHVPPGVRAQAARAITANALKIYEIQTNITAPIEHDSIEDLTMEQLLLLEKASQCQ